MKKFLTLVLVFSAFITMTLFNVCAEGIHLDTPPQEPIALFVQLDPEGVSKPLEISEEIYDKVKEILNDANKEPIIYTKAQKDLKVYIRDNDLNNNQRDQDKGVILRSKDFKALAEKNRHDM